MRKSGEKASLDYTTGGLDGRQANGTGTHNEFESSWQWTVVPDILKSHPLDLSYLDQASPSSYEKVQFSRMDEERKKREKRRWREEEGGEPG